MTLKNYITDEQYSYLLEREKRHNQYFYFTQKRPPIKKNTQAALVMAVLYKNADILKNMINCGLQVNKLFLKLQKYSTFNVNSGDKIPSSFFIAQYASPDMFSYILPYIDIHKSIPEKDASFLHIAARSGKSDILKELLDKGLDPNIQVAPYFCTVLSTVFEFDSYYRSPISSVLRSKEENDKSIDIMVQNTALILDKITPDGLCAKNYRGESLLTKGIQDKLWRPLELVLDKALEFQMIDKIQAQVLELWQNENYSARYYTQLQEFEKILKTYAEKQMFNQALQKQNNKNSISLVKIQKI